MTIETDINLMEHAGRTWRFVLKNEGGTILPLDNFMIYGAAACPGQAPRAFEVRVDAGVAVARMPGLPLTDYPWTYQLFAQEKSSRVEWLLCHGAVNLHGRVAGGSVVLDPELLEFTGVLDSTTQTAVMVIGESTLSISENTARAIQEAQTAKEKATEAGEQATAAGKAAQTAGEKATEAGEQATAAGKAADDAHEQATAAEASATDAANSARAAAGEVKKAAAEVEKAAAEVEKAKLERETAAGHADAAAKSAQGALANQKGAEQAAQAAAQAQVAAETAKADADAAKIAAQTSERNAKASADAAAADKTAAEKAKQDALAAQGKAEQEAVKAEQNAALLGDAALKGGDNEFSGNNGHSGSEIFNGAVVLNGTVDATAADMQLPVEVMREMSGWAGLMGPACTEVAMLGPMFGSTLENEVLVLNCPNLSNVSFSSTGLINSTLTGSGGQYDGVTLNRIGSATARVVVSIAPTVLTGETWQRWGKLEEVYILVTQGNYGRNQLPRAVLQQSGNFPKLRKLVVIAPFANVLPLYFTDGLTSVLDELIFIMPKMPTLEGDSSGTWTSMLGKIRGCSRARVYLPALQSSLTIGNTQMDSASVAFLLHGLPTAAEPPLTVKLGVGAGVLAGTDENGVQTYADETLTAAVAAAADKGWSVQLVDNSNAY